MSLEEGKLYGFGKFILDPHERLLKRGDETIPIPPKAVETLCLLVESHGKLLTKDVLMDELWGDTFVEDRNLAQNIFMLRKALGQTNNGDTFIETVPKRGYRFVADVRSIDEEYVEATVTDDISISAEGNVSERDLREMVRETVRHLRVDETQAGQIKKENRTRFFLGYPPAALIAIGIVTLLSIGGAGWFWINSGSSTERSSMLPIANSNARLERLTNSGKAWHPSISPDNRQLAYIHHEDNKDSIRLEHLATGSVTVVVPPTEADFGQPNFSRDGNYLFYSSRDGGVEATIYKTPIYGGSRQKITTNSRSDFSISPDGNRLAFVRFDASKNEFQMMVCNADGTGERVVGMRGEAEEYYVWGLSPSWSPDGKRIVSAALTRSKNKEERRQHYFVEIDVESGAEKRIRSRSFYKLSQPRWMPDGKRLVVLAQESANSPFQIWEITYSDGTTRRITNDLVSYQRLSISRDGSTLLTNERKETYNLALIDVRSGSLVEQLTYDNELQNGFYGLMWTPDGKQIVYSQTNNIAASNIWILDLDSKRSRQITFDEGKENLYPSVTPDGKSIIFSSNRTGNHHIWKMNLDGSDARAITDGPMESEPQISPDGKWLFYWSPEDLWRMPLEGGKAVEFRKHARRSNVSPDSKQIAIGYFDPQEKEQYRFKYGLMPVEGDTQIEDMGFLSNRIVRWTPDGSGIYFLNKTKNGRNVWVYSLASGDISEVTDLNDQRIANIGVSPDGRQIAVSRGFRESEIVKITGF